MNVDTAISSEHARIEFDSATGQFFICDGTADKPSTNGTWFRCVQSFSFFFTIFYKILFCAFDDSVPSAIHDVTADS